MKPRGLAHYTLHIILASLFFSAVSIWVVIDRAPPVVIYSGYIEPGTLHAGEAAQAVHSIRWFKTCPDNTVSQELISPVLAGTTETRTIIKLQPIPASAPKPTPYPITIRRDFAIPPSWSQYAGKGFYNVQVVIRCDSVLENLLGPHIVESTLPFALVAVGK